ncbi:MAG: flagellar basal body rod protein FlgC [Pyrinomonadaceae bacterium]|nr:flagellar basal body rod protein FlgC [Pyrinomonadaceae bacterium]
MSLLNILKIASQGMSAQRQRLEVSAANLANANTTRTASGKPYQRRDIVFEAKEINEAWKTSASRNGLIDSDQKAVGVESKITVADVDQYIRTHQPGHPDADERGYVNMPDVDPLEETVNMMSAARSFESNATVFNTAKELARVSLNLGDA